MYRIVFLLLSSIFLLRCTDNRNTQPALPYYNEPDFTPVFIADKDKIDKKITHTISNFSFLNEDSITVTQEVFEGKIHVANFIFTSCGSICPTMTKNMKILSDSLANHPNIVIMSYSVTPWIDKPWILKKYKKSYQITDKNWHFLTGSKSEIYDLARKSYFAEEDIGFSKDSNEFLHTEHFVLVDKTKRIRGIYNGTLTLEMQMILEDIKVLEQEK
jgi:protein SCO1/2